MVVGTVIRNLYAVSNSIRSFPLSTFTVSYTDYLIQYGMSQYDISWALQDGFIKPVIANAAEGLGVPALGVIVFVLFGKKLRRLTRNSKIHSF